MLPEVVLLEEVPPDVVVVASEEVDVVASKEADVVASVNLHHPAKISTRSSTRTSKPVRRNVIDFSCINCKKINYVQREEEDDVFARSCFKIVLNSFLMSDELFYLQMYRNISRSRTNPCSSPHLDAKQTYQQDVKSLKLFFCLKCALKFYKILLLSSIPVSLSPTNPNSLKKTG